MTVKKLASVLCKKEGKKVSISMGNAREIVGILSDILYIESPWCSTLVALMKNGKRRFFKAAQKKNKNKNKNKK